jgi:hypothetical protein
MGPVLGAALISGGLSYLGSRQSARMSQASAREQMAFQADQTGTGYQRAVADMKKAGLNPMLAAKLGPAASGSGAMAQIPDFGTAVQRGIQGGQLASASRLQEQQAVLTEFKAEGQQIDNEINRLSRLPEAEVKGFMNRLVSRVIKHVESYVDLAAENSEVFDNTEVNKLEATLKNLKRRSVDAFNRVLNGLDTTALKALETLDWFNEVIGE